MRKIIVPIIIAAVVLVGIVVIFILRGDEENTNTNITSVNSVLKNDNLNINSDDKDSILNKNSILNTNDVVMDNAQPGKYVDYSPQSYEEYKNQKRVLFFYASWCSTCMIANSDFEDNKDEIPSDVVIIKTDYDKQDDLKEKYGITYQHVFVQVDKDGNEITKWSGGGLNNLISKIK